MELINKEKSITSTIDKRGNLKIKKAIGINNKKGNYSNNSSNTKIYLKSFETV